MNLNRHSFQLSGLAIALLVLNATWNVELKAAQDSKADATQESSAEQKLAKEIEKLAKPYVEAKQVQGLSIGVLKGDQQATVHLGSKSKGGAKPDDDTIYEIGSISKVFTGVLLADAVERKNVRLDQDAQDLLPDGVKMPVGKERSVSLLDMSIHRSGLPRLPDNMPSLKTDDPYHDYNSKLAHEFLQTHQLGRQPGEKYEYSNFAVSLLGHLISSQQGVSYDQLLQDRIAKPLGMNNTRVELTAEMKKRLATPHTSVDSPGKNWTFADLPGAGGIRSSTSDMLRFAKANIAPDENEIGRAMELAWKKHQEGTAKEFAMGLGWHIARDKSTRWHNGQTGGYHGMLMINRENKIAVVLLTNTSTMEVDRLAEDIIQMLAGRDVKPRVFEKSVKVADDVMQQYVGKYELARNFVFTVSVDDGKLMVGVTNQPTFQVFARSDTEWFYKVVDATLTFKVKDGKCHALELFQNGVRQTAKRIESDD